MSRGACECLRCRDDEARGFVPACGLEDAPLGDLVVCLVCGVEGGSHAADCKAHGPTYARLAAEVADLVERKQVAYGDSFGKSGDVMRILYPNGIPPEAMGDALVIVRVLDKRRGPLAGRPRVRPPRGSAATDHEGRRRRRPGRRRFGFGCLNFNVQGSLDHGSFR